MNLCFPQIEIVWLSEDVHPILFGYVRHVTFMFPKIEIVGRREDFLHPSKKQKMANVATLSGRPH